MWYGRFYQGLNAPASIALHDKAVILEEVILSTFKYLTRRTTNYLNRDS
jgi:hypothetical protein